MRLPTLRRVAPATAATACLLAMMAAPCRAAGWAPAGNGGICSEDVTSALLLNLDIPVQAVWWYALTISHAARTPGIMTMAPLRKHSA